MIAMRVQRKTRSRTIDNQIYFVKIPDPPLSEQQQTRWDLIFENMVGEHRESVLFVLMRLLAVQRPCLTRLSGLVTK